MYLSEFETYLILAGAGNQLAYYTAKGDQLKDVFNKFERVCGIEKVNTYETYLTNEQGVTGWTIEHIRSTDSKIKKFPLFDCVITKNDSAGHEAVDFLSTGKDDYKYKGDFKAD